MSRIGKQRIEVPDGVSVNISGSEVHVKGPKGDLTTALPEGISIEVSDAQLVVKCHDERKVTRSYHGMVRALTNNMVTGVTSGFEKVLEIQGVGYRAEVKGKKLVLTLGFSHPVELTIPKGLSVSMDGGTTITIQGIDKQSVGQFSADVRALRPPEPYKGKGVRYRGEYVRRKVGKTGAA